MPSMANALVFLRATLVIASTCEVSQREPPEGTLHYEGREAKLQAWRGLFQCDYTKQGSESEGEVESVTCDSFCSLSQNMWRQRAAQCLE